MLKYVIMYADKIPENLPAEYKDKVFQWKDILQRGKNFVPKSPAEDIEVRIKEPKVHSFFFRFKDYIFSHIKISSTLNDYL